MYDEAQDVAPIVDRGSPVVAVVVGVEHHITLVAAVVLGLAQRVGDAEPEAVAVAAVGADLQAVVHRCAGVFRQPDGAVSQVRPERRDVHAGIRLDRAGPQLVDVEFALQIEPAAADVADVHHEPQWHFALDPGRPHVRGRMLEHRILRRHAERQVGGGRRASGRVVDDAVGDRDHRLERRVAAEQRRVVERDAIVEHAGADARDGLLVDRVGDAEPRLERVVVRFREPARLAAEERLHAWDRRQPAGCCPRLRIRRRAGRCR